MKVAFVPSCAVAVLAGVFPLSHASAQDAKPTPSVSPAPEKAADVPLPDTVATVDGDKITKEDLQKMFDKVAENAGVQIGQLSASQKLDGYRRVLDGMIIEKLVKAQSAGVKVTDAEIKAKIDEIKAQFPSEAEFKDQLQKIGQTEAEFDVVIRQGLQLERWLDGQIQGKDKVDDAEAKKFYDDNKAEFEQAETVKASHILFMVPKEATDEVVKQKEKAAKDAAARAKKGEDFEALAKELSEEPGAKERGGDLGFFSRERMVPEFSEAAFKQKTGEIGDPVRTEYGFHVIKVTDHKPGGTVSFEEVKPNIVQYLGETKRREAQTEVLKKLRDSAKVQINLPEPPPSPAPAGEASPAEQR